MFSKLQAEVLPAQNAIFRPFGINNLPKAEIEYSPVADLEMLRDGFAPSIQWRASIRVPAGQHRLVIRQRRSSAPVNPGNSQSPSCGLPAIATEDSRLTPLRWQ